LQATDKFIVCYVTDRHSLDIAAGENREVALAQHIEAALRAGIHWLQIREKDLPARKLAELTRIAVRACKNLPQTPGRSELRVLVNDRWDVAWVAGAGGAHAGEKSLPVGVLREQRRAAGLANFLIGASCHSLDAARNAAQEGADYVFFGPIFTTPAKAVFGPPQGLRKLEEVCGAVSIPVIAIGGINVENAAACREAGAAGIAAIRLFQQKGDLRETVAKLIRND
jgi:thiamine-phosphate pyrophosphorylase